MHCIECTIVHHYMVNHYGSKRKVYPRANQVQPTKSKSFGHLLNGVNLCDENSRVLWIISRALRVHSTNGRCRWLTRKTAEPASFFDCVHTVQIRKKSLSNSLNWIKNCTAQQKAPFTWLDRRYEVLNRMSERSWSGRLFGKVLETVVTLWEYGTERASTRNCSGLPCV